ncbi:MAG: tetratricopeptide repeat protein [Thermodesulfobacteriota bacterium]
MDRAFLRRLVFILIFCLLSVWYSPGQVRASGDLLHKAEELFKAGKYRKAREKLLKAFRNNPANPELNFYLGRTAFELGDYETAVMAFDRVLIIDPGAFRVKLEMARSYLRLGSLETARQLFEEVRATDPPLNVEKRIAGYLELIEQRTRRHFFKGSLEAGVSYDDNVRQTPTSDLISIGIYDFLLTGPEAEAQSDQVYNITLGLSHRYRFSRKNLSWKTSLLNYNDFYESNEDLDIYYFSLSSGPEWQIGRALWNCYTELKYVEVGQDRYFGSYGLGSQLTIPAFPWLSFTLAGRVEEKNNYQDHYKDATNILVSFQPVVSMGKNRFSLVFRQQFENSEAEFESYDRFAWRLRYDRLLPKQAVFFAGLGRMETDYDDPEPLFTEKRCDDLDELAAGLSKLLWKGEKGYPGLFAELAFLYLDSDSTLDLYTYRKKKVSFSLTLKF